MKHSPPAIEPAIQPSSADAFFWGLCYSHYLYPAYLTAWSTGLARKVALSPKTIAASAKKVGISVDAAIALLPTVVLFGGVRQNHDGRISRVGNGGRMNPDHWRPMIQRHALTDHHYARSKALFYSKRRAFGRSFWNKQFGKSKTLRLFLASIDAHSLSTAPRIAAELSARSRASLVDVGSGLGTNTFAAMEKLPHLRSVLIDQPATIRLLRRLPIFKRYKSRISSLAIDVTNNPWPKVGDVYLLAHFLHDFGLADRTKLLKRAQKDLPPNSELWIHGHFWQGESASPTVAALSYYLYCHLGGGILSVDQQIIECRMAGFIFVKAIKTSPTQMLLVFTRRKESR